MEFHLEREKKAKANWKMVVTKIIICRYIVGNLDLAKPEQDEVNLSRVVVKKRCNHFSDGSYIIYPDRTYMQVWIVMKTTVYMVSLFTVMYYAAFDLDNKHTG
jgi:hypothetical protein